MAAHFRRLFQKKDIHRKARVNPLKSKYFRIICPVRVVIKNNWIAHGNMYLVAVCTYGRCWISDSLSKYLRLKSVLWWRLDLRCGSSPAFALLIIAMKFNLRWAGAYLQSLVHQQSIVTLISQLNHWFEELFCFFRPLTLCLSVKCKQRNPWDRRDYGS